MKIVDLEKLKSELNRKPVLKNAYQELRLYPFVEQILQSTQPITVCNLEELSRQLHELLIELRELCNGSISTDTPLTLYYEPDPESEDPSSKLPFLVATGPESLGAWKSRLKEMKKQLRFDEDAVQLIDKKLKELYELKFLCDEKY